MKEIVNSIAIDKHANDLMNRDPGPFHTGLTVTNLRVDGDPFEHSFLILDLLDPS